MAVVRYHTPWIPFRLANACALPSPYTVVSSWGVSRSSRSFGDAFQAGCGWVKIEGNQKQRGHTSSSERIQNLFLALKLGGIGEVFPPHYVKIENRGAAISKVMGMEEGS